MGPNEADAGRSGGRPRASLAVTRPLPRRAAFNHRARELAGARGVFFISIKLSLSNDFEQSLCRFQSVVIKTITGELLL